jgi:hypothetical protein
MAEREVGPQQVEGRWLTCAVCQHDQFWTRRTLMTTRRRALFDLEWSGKEAINYVCGRCGYVHWFLRDG